MVLRPLMHWLFRKVLLHALFWLTVFLFFTYFFEYDGKQVDYSGSFSVFLMPVVIATTYTVVYYLVPILLLQKKYLLFILHSFYTLVLSAYAIVVSIFYGLIFLHGQNYNSEVPIGKSLPITMVVVYLVVLLVSAFTLLRYSYASLAKNKELENKILQAQLRLKEQELYFLKMQVHPHFLFNTLNTLYGYALKKADEAPDMILKLSNLLDYLLYQVDKPAVSLANEIDHLRDYIALEQIRFRDSLQVHLDLPDIDKRIMIAPMLLIPFVENSFKHGEIVSGSLQISIHLTIEDSNICFSVKNSVRQKEDVDRTAGIGLENVQKRLSLLYLNQHSLSINQDSDWFSISLTLNHLKLSNYGQKDFVPGG